MNKIQIFEAKASGVFLKVGLVSAAASSFKRFFRSTRKK